MNIGNITRTLGILITLFSVTMMPPLLLSWYYHDGGEKGFTYGLFLTMSMGFLLWFACYNRRGNLKVRDGLVLTVLFWSVLSLMGAIPLAIAIPSISVTDAIFESVSGFTTTGATVLQNIESLPRSVLFYRQQLQWLGGIGIVVLAVAILPMLGLGGVRLYKAETSGQQKSNYLTTSIADTAKILWYIYLGLTALCMLAYYFAGMSFFDALSHSFSTIAIGGFSTYDDSIGAFDNPYIEAVAVVFMFVSGVNFSLHFVSWKKRTLVQYIRDKEFRFYITVLLSVIICCFLVLYFSQGMNTLEAARKSIFQSVSMATTTGFSTDAFANWPLLLPVLLVMASFAGGCTGSTAGGMKALRILLLLKQGYRELKRILHPHAVFNIRLSRVPVYERTIDAVWGFFALYIIMFIFIMLCLMASGIDSETAWSATAATLNNLGPGLGKVADNYGQINDFSKWILSFSMLIGRLEIFTVLVLFTPIMWRQ